MSHIYSQKCCMVCTAVTDCMVHEDGFVCLDCYESEVMGVQPKQPDVYKQWQESVLRIRDKIIERNKALDKDDERPFGVAKSVTFKMR